MFDVLREKPWSRDQAVIPKEVLLPRGMLGVEERGSLWWLARHVATGRAIIDAGSYIGASGFCLASGAASNPRYPRDQVAVHSYDYFEAFDRYVAQAITDTLRPCEPGENYLDIYRWQTGFYRDLVHPYPGDFLLQRWGGGPIDICFIDLAKTQPLSSHALCQFLPAMTVGQSVLIQQDFYHCWHPYMQIAMEYLHHRLDVLDPHILWQSRLYGLVSMPTAEEFQRIEKWEFTPAEELELLDRYIDKERGDLKAMAHVVKLCQLWIHKDVAGYDAERARLSSAFDPAQSQQLWAVQLGELDHHMERLRS